MKTKLFDVKQIDEAGEGSAVIATLNVVDKDGDITLPGAFGNQPVAVVPAHNWSSVPLGKGVVSESGEEAIAKFKFNLDSPTAKEWHSALKFDMANGRPLHQWSYGYDIEEAEAGKVDGQNIQYLKKLKVFEVSPVLLGAGINTRTLEMKNRLKLSREFESLESALSAAIGFSKRVEALAALREKEGRSLSPANRERLEKMLESLAQMKEEIDSLLVEPKDGKGAELFASFQRTLANINHTLGVH